MSVRVFAPAKINLTLEVGRPRADGRHPLQSVVVFASVGDVVEAAPAPMLSLVITGRFAGELACDESNLVLRAARALAAAAGIAEPGAALMLTKNLPVASGIGGGSADAAATLKALNDLWGLGLDAARLAEIGAGLGADVPVCVGGRSAFMTGIGETSTPIDAPEFDAVLLNPLKPLATAEVYRQFDAMQLGAGFTPRPPPAWPGRDACLAELAAIGNDLEAPAHALMPELSQMRSLLRRDGRVRHLGLSGSGATMFALLDSDADAEAFAAENLDAQPLWWVCATRLRAA